MPAFSFQAPVVLESEKQKKIEILRKSSPSCPLKNAKQCSSSVVVLAWVSESLLSEGVSGHDNQKEGDSAIALLALKLTWTGVSPKYDSIDGSAPKCRRTLVASFWPAIGTRQHSIKEASQELLPQRKPSKKQLCIPKQKETDGEADGRTDRQIDR